MTVDVSGGSGAGVDLELAADQTHQSSPLGISVFDNETQILNCIPAPWNGEDHVAFVSPFYGQELGISERSAVEGQEKRAVLEILALCRGIMAFRYHRFKIKKSIKKTNTSIDDKWSETVAHSHSKFSPNPSCLLA